ncbi:MAG TPA: branched-chain amino acid ABC transporter permease [Fibrobacteria bacterium]|nr:branched-chain amino acid ABC transporter permease [Fibrobacteria bacterium]
MDNFLQQVINGVSLGSIYALVALGYTMVYGVMRLINFAHGDIYMLGAFIGYYVSKAVKGSLAGGGWFLETLVVLLASMAACALIGVLMERLAYRPVRRASRLTMLIIAIGVSLLIENGGQLVFGAAPRFFPQLIPETHFELGALSLTNQQVIVLVTAILLMVLLNFFVYRTRTGKAMRAVSFNLDAAKLMGIDTDRIIALTFALGSALAAAGGILVSINIPGIDPLMGVMTGLKAFVAAVLGGIGNIFGAVVGGLILGLAEVMISGYGSSTYRDAIAFVILIAILLFKPSGILGKGQVEKV